MQAKATLIDKAPAALAKLKSNGGEVQALTMAEISAVALRYFSRPLKAGLKSSVVVQLRALITSQPAILDLPANTDPTAPPANACSPAHAAFTANTDPLAITIPPADTDPLAITTPSADTHLSARTTLATDPLADTTPPANANPPANQTNANPLADTAPPAHTDPLTNTAPPAPPANTALSAAAAATPLRPTPEKLEAADEISAFDSDNDGSDSDTPRGPTLEELEVAAESDAYDSAEDGSSSEGGNDIEVGGGAVGLKRPREEGK